MLNQYPEQLIVRRQELKFLVGSSEIKCESPV
jgi:hypothetical protein